MEKQKRNRAQWQEANINRILLASAKSRAKKTNLDFNLTLDDIIVPMFCPILGVKLDHTRNIGRRFNGASLDRIDSSKGYVKGNVWVISDLANRMKQDASIEQLKTFGEWTQTL